MKILELGKFYPPYRGGMETLLRVWSEGFAQRGAEVTCVVANDQPRTVRESLNGVQVHRLASYGTAMSTSICPGYLGATRRHSADLWHMHAPNPLADLACLRGDSRTPLIVSYHSDVIRQARLMRLYSPLLRRLLERADVIVVGTPLHIEHSPWLPQFRDKCEVIPFGLDLARFKSTPALDEEVSKFRAASNDKPVIFTVGRLVGYKGIRHLIEATAKLDAVLWIGGTGPLEGELRQQAQELGVAGRVEFLGAIPEAQLPARMRACDVFVLPSITPNEAFGLVQVEAMACGRPVVSCDLPSGVPWVNLDGVTGLIVPPADASALAIALQRLFKDARLREQMGEAGRLRAEREFDQSIMLDRYWNCVKKLTTRSTRHDDV